MKYQIYQEKIAVKIKQKRARAAYFVSISVSSQAKTAKEGKEWRAVVTMGSKRFNK